MGRTGKGAERRRRRTFRRCLLGFGVAHCQMGMKASWDVHDSPEQSNLQDAWRARISQPSGRVSSMGAPLLAGGEVLEATRSRRFDMRGGCGWSMRTGLAAVVVLFWEGPTSNKAKPRRTSFNTPKSWLDGPSLLQEAIAASLPWLNGIAVIVALVQASRECS